ncbi:MAG: Fe-S cluster assembly ATPase SufC [Candidatus Altiarchaeota archaeon]|nr:Fe-S cluster assembly ATPase SufC [Candidatus Altiarchaeota archaeon]
MIRLKNLTVNIDGSRILDDVNLIVEPGQIVAVMGPNGSGKSTLAKAIMGDPSLEIHGDILLDGKSLNGMPTNERANQGIFLSFQNPPEIEGVKSEYFLATSFNKEWDEITEVSKKLGITPELLSKDLNVGFSGGERKKMEMLQAILKNPRLVILDEIDSGLDIDAVKLVSKFMKTMRTQNQGVLIITHQTSLFDNIRPDKVYILSKGKIVEEGGPDLLSKLNDFGFEGWN